jgi:hypothetical protein
VEAILLSQKWRPPELLQHTLILTSWLLLLRLLLLLLLLLLLGLGLLRLLLDCCPELVPYLIFQDMIHFNVLQL